MTEQTVPKLTHQNPMTSHLNLGGSSAGLPPAGWSSETTSGGKQYFFNKATGTSTYEHPLDASFKSYYSKIKSSGA